MDESQPFEYYGPGRPAPPLQDAEDKEKEAPHALESLKSDGDVEMESEGDTEEKARKKEMIVLKKGEDYVIIQTLVCSSCQKEKWHHCNCKSPCQTCKARDRKCTPGRRKITMKTYERKLSEGWTESSLKSLAVEEDGVTEDEDGKEAEPPFFEEEIEIFADLETETEETSDRAQTPPPGRTKRCNNCQKAGKKCKPGRPCPRCVRECLDDCSDGIDMRTENAKKRKKAREEEDVKSGPSDLPEPSEEEYTPRETRNRKKQKKEQAFSPWSVPDDSPHASPPPAYDSASHSHSHSNASVVPQLQSPGAFKPSPKDRQREGSEQKKNPLLLALAQACGIDPDQSKRQILEQAAVLINSLKSEKEEAKTQLLTVQALLDTANTELFGLRDFKEKTKSKEKKSAEMVKGLEDELESLRTKSGTESKEKDSQLEKLRLLVTEKQDSLVRLATQLDAKTRELEGKKKAAAQDRSTHKDQGSLLAAKTKELEELKARLQIQEQELKATTQKLSEQKGYYEGLVAGIRTVQTPQAFQVPQVQQQTLPVYYHPHLPQVLQGLQALNGQTLVRYVSGSV